MKELLIEVFYAVKTYELATGRSVLNEKLYFRLKKVVEDAISKDNISRSTG